MTDPKNDPIKAHETITINVCDVCKTRFSLEEAQQRDMTCCGQALKQIKERVPVPMGP